MHSKLISNNISIILKEIIFMKTTYSLKFTGYNKPKSIPTIKAIIML